MQHKFDIFDNVIVDHSIYEDLVNRIGVIQQIFPDNTYFVRFKDYGSIILKEDEIKLKD